MKKLLLFAASLLVSAAMMAELVPVSLENPQQINTPVTATVTDGTVTVAYDFTASGLGSWPNGGVKFALDNVTGVQSVNFEYIGGEATDEWVSLFVYLEDETGARWVQQGTLNISGTPTEWTAMNNFVVSEGLWGNAVTGTTAEHQIVAIGFMVNPGNGVSSTYGIRNVSLNVVQGVGPAPTEDYEIDFATASIISANGTNCTWTVAEGELNAAFDFSAAAAGSWPNGGIEIALPNLTNVKGVAFDFKADASIAEWTSFHVYLKDAAGLRWINSAADLHLNGVTDWTHKQFMPTTELWGNGSNTMGDTFIALGFLANPGNPMAASFYLRDVKIIVEAEEVTALETLSETTKAVKFYQNGQLYIMRDGRVYNALGAEVK